MKSRHGIVLAIATLFAIVPSVSRADVIIDDFNNVTIFEVFNPPVTGQTTVAASGNVGVFPTRTYFLTIDGGGSPVTGVSFTTDGSVLGFSTDAGVSASGDVTWDNNGADLNANLASELGFSIDARADRDIDADITVMSGGNPFTVPFVIPNLPLGVFQTFFFPFAGFGVGFDPSDIDSITLRIAPGQGTTEGDAQFDNFGTFVPEPTSFVILGAAAMGLVALRRRRTV